MELKQSIVMQFKNRYHEEEIDESDIIVENLKETPLGIIVSCTYVYKPIDMRWCNSKNVDLRVPKNEPKDIHLYLVDGNVYPDNIHEQLKIDLNLISLLNDKVGSVSDEGVKGFQRPNIVIKEYDPNESQITADISEIFFEPTFLQAEETNISSYLRKTVDYELPFNGMNIIKTYIEYLTALTSVKGLSSDEDRKAIGKILISNYRIMQHAVTNYINNLQCEDMHVDFEKHILPIDITYLIQNVESFFKKGQIIKSNLRRLIHFHGKLSNYIRSRLPGTLDLKRRHIGIVVEE